MFKDKVLQKLVKKYPKPDFKDRSESIFERLVDSIISQQLSVKAANTIFLSFVSLFETKTFPTPVQIIQMPINIMRTAGISRPKIAYIKSLAKNFNDGEIDIMKLKKMTDEEVIAELTKLKGVGQWTAEMILIFTLNRPDVFSLGDAGLRRAIYNLYRLTDKNQILSLTEKWKPYRSTASWYLWKSLDNLKKS